MSTEKRKGLLDDLPNCHAVFKAKHLHALRGILDRAREWQFFHPAAGLFIEPAEKGVFLIATDGWSQGVIYDAEGYANKPFRALLPKMFCARAAPAAPLQVFRAGPAEIELPEWAQPSQVAITPVCALIFPQMNHPSVEDPAFAPALASVRIETGNEWREDDFRLQEDKKIPWRKQLSGQFGPHSAICVRPSRLAVFDPLKELCDASQPASFSIAFHANPFGPHVLRLKGVPEFCGAFMGQKFVEPDPLPEWLSFAPHGANAEPASVHPFPAKGDAA